MHFFVENLTEHIIITKMLLILLRKKIVHSHTGIRSGIHNTQCIHFDWNTWGDYVLCLFKSKSHVPPSHFPHPPHQIEPSSAASDSGRRINLLINDVINIGPIDYQAKLAKRSFNRLFRRFWHFKLFPDSFKRFKVARLAINSSR